jgi:hypothetical protein
VENPEPMIEKIIAESEAGQLRVLEAAVDRIASQWSQRVGIEIRLQPEAARLLSQKSIESGERVDDVFARIFKNYEYGLNLIRQTKGISSFEITPDVVLDPEATLDRWIRSYYISDPNR